MVVKKKAIEQNHLTLAFPGLSFADPGGSSSSSCPHPGGGSSACSAGAGAGLCYSIYSYGTCHDDTGYFGVYTALGRDRGQALDTILAVIRELTEHGVTQAELDRAREAVQGQRAHGAGIHQSHMSSLGRGELLGRGAGRDAIIAAYDAVTRTCRPGRSCSGLKTPPLRRGAGGSADAYRALLH